MSSILSVATSGMQAASARLDVAASNIANSQTTGPLPTSTASSSNASTSGFPSAYVPLAVNQVDISKGSASSGTLATAVPVSPSFVPVSDPRAPVDYQNGLRAGCN